jgi:hypothetical protein
MGFRPYTYKTPQHGEKEYKGAIKRYDEYAGKYSDMISGAVDTTKEAVGEAKGLTDYYKPGGGYGKGQKTQATENVRAGEAKALGGSVASGMSSQFSARGINVLAGAELSKLYSNIEDTRNALLMQAFTPYAQMIQTLGSLASSGASVLNAAPTRSKYVTQGQPYISGVGREI